MTWNRLAVLPLGAKAKYLNPSLEVDDLGDLQLESLALYLKIPTLEPTITVYYFLEPGG